MQSVNLESVTACKVGHHVASFEKKLEGALCTLQHCQLLSR